MLQRHREMALVSFTDNGDAILLCIPTFGMELLLQDQKESNLGCLLSCEYFPFNNFVVHIYTLFLSVCFFNYFDADIIIYL